MLELQIGIIKANELADWFGIKLKSFSNTRAKKLKELEEYADFEDLGKTGINIINIKKPIYIKSKAYNIIAEEFDKAWGINGNKLDTCVNAAKKIYDRRNNDLTVKENTLITYTGNYKRETYGAAYSKNGAYRGTKGHCEIKLCKYIDNNYIPFTPAEEKIKKEIYRKYFKEIGEQIEELQKIKTSIKDGDITKEEYLFQLEAFTDSIWTNAIIELEKVLECPCKFATLLIDEAY